jgi:hypothetical protein
MPSGGGSYADQCAHDAPGRRRLRVEERLHASQCVEGVVLGTQHVVLLIGA